MANDYFDFKQFRIRQNRCAMKITTLACIQGAWLPDISPKNIIDVGAGTGLLSLMVAQKFDGEIDAVEIDGAAFLQLRENINQSPWNHRIRCHHTGISVFEKENKIPFDFIITNPPFFRNQLKSSKAKVNLAKHEDGLLLEDLIKICSKLIGEWGIISILLPVAAVDDLKRYCSHYSLNISDQLVITDSGNKKPNAIISYLSRSRLNPWTKQICIKNRNGDYSKEFIALLKDYYLNL